MFLSVFHPEVIYIADGTRYKRHGFVLTFYLYIFIYIYILFFFEVGVVFRSRLTCSFICADGHDHIEFFSFFFFYLLCIYRYMVKPLGRGEGHGIYIATTFDEVRVCALI